MKKILQCKSFIPIAFLIIFVGCSNLKRNLPFINKSEKIIIAHRGASGYLPEHTLESYSYAFALGADFIEPDLVITKDNQVIVMHDTHLDTTTNVAQVFPQKKRKDGRYYVIDFTLKEIKQLRVFERINLKSRKAVYSKRFPIKNSKFEVPTFREFIELIQGLEKSTGRKVGIYPEIKAPEFHKKYKKPIVRKTIQLLKEYGYDKKLDQVFLQCFEPKTLKDLKFKYKVPYPLVQLIAENSWNETSADYEKMKTSEGVKDIASYASGVGPWINQLVDETGRKSDFFKFLKKSGLKIHPYTVRKDQLQPFASNIDEVFKVLFEHLKVDGAFTDFPDLGLKYLDQN
jgi:glycerophosphoryl diester phosphodiesterase